MPPKPENPDPLAREVERLLKKLPGADPSLRGDPGPATRSVGVISGPRPAASVRGATTTPTARDYWMMWGRLAAAVALGVALGQWPYSTACGWPLTGYIVAVLVLLVVAGWAAVGAWRLHVGLVHIAALLMLVWGLVLGAEQLLPRVGYAARSATWGCRVRTSTSPSFVPFVLFARK